MKAFLRAAAFAVALLILGSCVLTACADRDAETGAQTETGKVILTGGIGENVIVDALVDTFAYQIGNHRNNAVYVSASSDGTQNYRLERVSEVVKSGNLMVRYSHIKKTDTDGIIISDMEQWDQKIAGNYYDLTNIWKDGAYYRYGSVETEAWMSDLFPTDEENAAASAQIAGLRRAGLYAVLQQFCGVKPDDGFTVSANRAGDMTVVRISFTVTDKDGHTDRYTMSTTVSYPNANTVDWSSEKQVTRDGDDSYFLTQETSVSVEKSVTVSVYGLTKVDLDSFTFSE